MLQGDSSPPAEVLNMVTIVMSEAVSHSHALLGNTIDWEIFTVKNFRQLLWRQKLNAQNFFNDE